MPSATLRRGATGLSGVIEPLRGTSGWSLDEAVSIDAVATSGIDLMMPTSSSRSAASLLNAWSSPAKNFWFAALSCQRR